MCGPSRFLLYIPRHSCYNLCMTKFRKILRWVLRSLAALLAATVASCMASMMAYLGARRGIDTKGISIESGYEEGKNGLSALVFHITVPHAVAEAERSVLEAAVKGCPVGAAIAPSVEKKISWTWAE